MAARYCPVHTSMEMTQLFTSWVCDACDPPKRTIPKNPLAGYTTSAELGVHDELNIVINPWAEELWRHLTPPSAGRARGMPEFLEPHTFGVMTQRAFDDSHVVLVLTNSSSAVYVEKNKIGKPGARFTPSRDLMSQLDLHKRLFVAHARDRYRVYIKFP